MGAISTSFFQRVEKLRRCAAKAERGNFVTNTPLIIPAAWLANTAYVQGDVRSNNGSWYMCITSGTSAGSGGPTATTGAAITDNTCSWTYLGGPTVAASDAQAPTISTQNTTPSGLTNYWNCILYPNLFRPVGGYVTTFATNYWKLFTFNSIGATATPTNPAVEFYTDAPKFALGVTNAAPSFLRIAVDEGSGYRWLTVDHTAATTGATPNWFVIDYSSVAQRKLRKVRVYAPNLNTFTFAGVRATANDMVYAAPTADSVKAIFISDSLFAGSSYGPFSIGMTTAQQVGALLGWDDVWDMSTGGTGHIATNTGANYNFGQRIADASNAATIAAADVVNVMGSTNDIGQSGITAAVTAEIQAIRALNAGCIINYLGVWSLNNAGVTTVESAVQAGVTAANDSRTFFTPIFADPTIPWVTGAWNNSGNTGSTNAGMYISGDNTHPPDIGTAYLAQRIAKAFKTNVLPLAV